MQLSLSTPRVSDNGDAGASAVEYALIIAGIAAVVVVVLGVLGVMVFDTFSTSKDCIEAGSSSTC